MTTDPRTSDLLLKRALAELAAGPDSGRLTADVLLTVDTTAQGGPVAWPRVFLGRQLAIVLASGLLLAVLIGAVALYSGVIPKPNPAPANSADGPIVVRTGFTLGDGDPSGKLIALDPATGAKVGWAGEAAASVAGIYGRWSTERLAWSPDGVTLAYERDGDVMVTGDGAPRAIASCASINRSCTDLDWSPDGATLAIASDSGLYLVDVATERSTRLLDAGAWVHGISWAPDGERLALIAEHTVNQRSELRLQTINRDGSGLARVAVPEPGTLAFDWSPDGDQIAYLGLQPVEGTVQGLRRWTLVLYVTGPGGTNTRELADLGTCYCTGTTDVAWSPSGNQIAILKPDRASGPNALEPGLYVVDTDGTDLRFVVGDVQGPIGWQAIAP